MGSYSSFSGIKSLLTSTLRVGLVISLAYVDKEERKMKLESQHLEIQIEVLASSKL